MKKNYHFCISGGGSLICRTEADYHRAFNCLALAAYQTDSSLLAEAIMSNHIHVCARSNDILALTRNFRYAYSRYFNKKYCREGRLGEKECFINEIEGFHHYLAAICYVLRNALHHGVAKTAFGYKHCSANALFMKDLGQDAPKQCLSLSSYYRFLPRGAEFPSRYKMSSDGVFLRESVLDVTDAEHYFGTARSYLFYMNRLSSEEWTHEQEKDMNGRDFVTLDSIEAQHKSHSIQRMLRNEHGRDTLSMSDIELCTLIDNHFLPIMGEASVYRLSEAQKKELRAKLRKETYCPESQLLRCLG